MKWESLVSLILSSISVLGALYTYIVHNRKLNKQQEDINLQTKEINQQTKLINNFQLEKNEKEIEENKKAIIEAYAFKGLKNWIIKIYNKGKAKATNIRLESDDLKEEKGFILFHDDLLPYPSLIPQHSFEIHVLLTTGCINAPKIKLIWDDDYDKDRYLEQNINF